MSEICKDLNKLTPTAKKAAEYLLEACEAAGLNIKVTETLRTVERQQYLYAQGRTRPGKVVTQLDGVKSKSVHQSGNAFDICQNIRGREYEEAVMNKVGEFGMQIGLDWGGSWKSFVDSPHFEVKKGVEPKRIVKQVPEYNVTKTRLNLNGNIKEVDTILLEGFNHIKLRDIADDRITINYKDGKVLINDVHFTGASIFYKDTNYVKLRDLPAEMFTVDYVEGIPVLSLK